MKDPMSKFIIIYASQTGQAKAIAESIFDLANEKKNFKPEIHCISQHDKAFKLNEITVPVVFISSTTGDGETPETAFKCWNKLKRLNPENSPNYLSNLNYALLGLGDTNYTQFANGPKLFHKKFTDLGAKCFFGPFYADDGTDLEIVVEPFKENLWKALTEFISSQEQTNSDINQLNKELNNLDIEYRLPLLAQKHLSIQFSDSILSDNKPSTEYYLKLHSIPQLYVANISDNKVLTSSDAVKTTYSLKFNVDSTYPSSDQLEYDYQPGHSFNILCPNDANEVSLLLHRLKCSQIDNKILINLNSVKKKTGMDLNDLTQEFDMSLKILFTHYLDIRSTSIKKALLRMLSEFCSDKSDQLQLMELCSIEGSAKYQHLIKENALSLLDLLNMFKSCEPPVDYLIQMLQQLQPRSYSFCSAGGKQMEIIFNLIKFDQLNSRTYSREGIATGYLSRLEIGNKFLFFKRKIQNFIFPTDLTEKPVILMGPGTGLAPLMSLLRSKLNQLDSLQKCWLFYGCRDPLKDFLFKDELINVYGNELKRFNVSFSRVESEQIVNDKQLSPFYEPEFKYIHDTVRFYAKEIAQLIYEQEAFVYVCGDALKMSKDAFQTLADCLSQEYKLSAEESKNYLFQMMKTKRYREDIWG